MASNDGLSEADIAILRVIDGLRSVYEYAPIESIIEKLPYSPKKVIYHIERLAKYSLVKYVYVPQLNTKGARITEKGFDALALWDFKKHNVISEVGNLIGVGKEATIINALGPENEFLVVKFHRWWIHEFKKIKKSLAYASIMWRGEQLNLEDYEIEIPRAKAQIEMFALQKLSQNKLSVPEPRGINRHAIVMKMIEREPGVPAPRLVDIRLSNPTDAYEIIIEDYIQMINKCGIVHGDLSEFNILVDKDGDLYYIDFPQAVPIEFPGAYELIIRDIQNINTYFRKKYSVPTFSVEDVLQNLKIKD